MITRAEYMANSSELHHAYHAQFVTPCVISIVRQRIGVKRIKASIDPHMNDIPLIEWDRLESAIKETCAQRALGEAEGFAPGSFSWSLGTSVCIAKTAARIIKGEQS